MSCEICGSHRERGRRRGAEFSIRGLLYEFTLLEQFHHLRTIINYGRLQVFRGDMEKEAERCSTISSSYSSLGISSGPKNPEDPPPYSN
jgi:hypothetical protein